MASLPEGGLTIFSDGTGAGTQILDNTGTPLSERGIYVQEMTLRFIDDGLVTAALTVTNVKVEAHGIGSHTTVKEETRESPLDWFLRKTSTVAVAMLLVTLAALITVTTHLGGGP